MGHRMLVFVLTNSLLFSTKTYRGTRREADLTGEYSFLCFTSPFTPEHTGQTVQGTLALIFAQNIVSSSAFFNNFFCFFVILYFFSSYEMHVFIVTTM